MQDTSHPSFVGLTLGHWRFVSDYWESSRVDTTDEYYEITSQSVPAVENVLLASAGLPEPISSETKQTLKTPQTSTNTDTIITSKVIVGVEKAESMVIDVTVFQALINIIETL